MPSARRRRILCPGISWRTRTIADANGYSDAHCNSYGDTYANADRNSNSDSETYSYSEVYSHAKGTAHSPAETLMCQSSVTDDR